MTAQDWHEFIIKFAEDQLSVSEGQIPSTASKTRPSRFPALEKIAAGRDCIRTDEFAKIVSREPQTIRKKYCLTGECFGVTPTKFGNKLLWPVAAIAALLAGERP